MGNQISTNQIADSVPIEQRCTINFVNPVFSPILSDQCQLDCTKAENKAYCDQQSINLCSNYYFDTSGSAGYVGPELTKYCGCIRSTNPLNLKCVDPVCDADQGSYITSSTQSEINACLSGGTTICQQIIECKDSATCEVNDNKFNTICGGDADNTFLSINIIWIIVSVIIIIILILIFMIIYFS